MNVRVELLEYDVVSVLFLRLQVHLLFARLHTVLRFQDELSLVLVQQLHRFTVDLRILVLESGAVETNLWSLEHALEVLQQLPDVGLVVVPFGKRVRCVENAREWTDEWMERRVVEMDLLESESGIEIKR